MEFSALRYSWHAVETRHAMQRLQWLLRRLPKMSRGNTTDPSFLRVSHLVSPLLDETGNSFPFIPLSILITQRLTRQILIRQGGSQRTVGNSEKATLVGRQPSKLPTMDDRSLVHRCSNYPPLTFDLGKFSFPMFPVQFFFLFRTTRRVLFF